MKKYSFNSDGEIFINGIPLPAIEEAIAILRKADLDVSSAMESLSFILPQQENKLICANCCAKKITCRHKGMHTHPHDCEKIL